MVGDRKFDVIGARNCGLKAIGALWGYGGPQELAEADALAERPADVIELSRRLWSGGVHAADVGLETDAP